MAVFCLFELGVWRIALWVSPRMEYGVAFLISQKIVVYGTKSFMQTTLQTLEAVDPSEGHLSPRRTTGSVTSFRSLGDVGYAPVWTSNFGSPFETHSQFTYPRMRMMFLLW
jgi:hypothetical protein